MYNEVEYDETSSTYLRFTKSISCRKKGAEAGTSKGNHGYNMYKGKPLHNVVWILHNGSIPEGRVIDHKNGIINDNRIDNLRLCTRTQNNHNAKIRKDNKTGYKGIKKKANGSYCARIQCNGKRLSKVHNDIEVVKHWLDNKRIELHGDFAKFN